MLISTRKEASIQSARHHAFKVCLGTLPQFRDLEDSFVRTPNEARNGAERYAGGQVVRGESGIGLHHRRSLGDFDCGTGRAFIPTAKGEVSCGVNR